MNADDGSIDLVHCYSMRNGLYGRQDEARIFWSRIDFSKPNYHRHGEGDNIRAVSIPIKNRIQQFAVHESDLSAFLLSHSKNFELIMHVVPGPFVKRRSMRTFVFKPDDRKPLNIDDMLILPEA